MQAVCEGCEFRRRWALPSAHTSEYFCDSDPDARMPLHGFHCVGSWACARKDVYEAIEKLKEL